MLLELLPATFEPWGSSGAYPSRPPTDLSIQKIEAELGVSLPALLIQVARACPSYGGWFGSIGDDFDSGNHMLSINRDFRADGMPPHYVLLNHGHDGHCDAWDTAARPVNGSPQRSNATESPIVYFNHDRERRELSGLRSYVASFADYIDALVRTYAPRCPVKNLRRHAKRILAEHSGDVKS